MAENYDDCLRQLRSGGLLVGALEVCGRVRRCKVEGEREQRGWYILHPIRTDDGRDLIVGSWGIWHGTDNGARKIELGKADRLSPEQMKAIRDRAREDRRRAAALREAEAKRAQARAEELWRRSLLAPAGDQVPEYLKRKGVGAHDVRYTPSGAIVVPMGGPDGRIRGVQFILDRAAHAKRIRAMGTDKLFWPAGCQISGSYHLLGAPERTILLAEGYATGASLHEATGFPVAVAFNANNLVPVAEALHRRYPAAFVLVCADDDFATKGNPGVTSASAAALVCGGAWVAPWFVVPDQVEIRARIGAEIDWAADDHRARVGDILRGRRKLTDFNDLHVAEGLLLVRSQIESKLDVLGRGRAVLPPPPTTGGRGGAAADWSFPLDHLQEHYTLIYGTDTAFDGRRHRIIGLGPLRAAAGKGTVRMWLESPERRTCFPEDVGFDPAGTDPAVRCNLWSGWPTVPRAGSCARLLELLEYLCNGDPAQQCELFAWVLCWIAYPLQHPGAKMATAILMHGPEGSGKNTFFGALRQLYAAYACQFSQVELESQFNGWASGKLFAIGNEVVSRAELYHIQGRLKSMVTEPEWIINEKMLPARSEQNHCNFVFFSNRIDIAKLDPGDRRYCVVWTPPALPSKFYQEVAEEIAAGGVAALHHHLLHLDLGEFNPHTKPPMTTAKAELVELGMDSTERFFRDWTAGTLGLPAVACVSEDLYAAYRVWCQREGIGKAAQKQTLLTAIGKRPGVRKVQERYLRHSQTEKRTVIFCPGYAQGPADGGNRQVWIGQQVSEFAGALLAYRESAA